MQNLKDFFENNHYLADEMAIWLGNESCAGNAVGYIMYDHIGLDRLRKELPDYKVYALRESDELNGDPATMENKEVIVNFFGYFISKTDFDSAFANKDWVEVYEWDYDPHDWD